MAPQAHELSNKMAPQVHELHVALHHPDTWNIRGLTATRPTSTFSCSSLRAWCPHGKLYLSFYSSPHNLLSLMVQPKLVCLNLLCFTPRKRQGTISYTCQIKLVTTPELWNDKQLAWLLRQRVCLLHIWCSDVSSFLHQKMQARRFLEKDESSRICAGNKETVTTKKSKKQHRLLNDTI
ncbi:hypothetical protein PR048_016574 [Dryococelus australis]|uniref:Uncharacterized protein n=1 Tax=Dryococelus australis TaxID=614101 RepID=A0ABQ9HK40_9NEOP|nr:hypothetical protein PR048_016574 [Dryococelus australis]